MTHPKQGTWMIYNYGPRFESIHTDVQEAIRITTTRGYGKVGWLPYGVALDDAVKAWESHEPLQIGVVDETHQWVNVEELIKAAGVELTSFQSDAIRFFMSTATSEEKPE